MSKFSILGSISFYYYIDGGYDIDGAYDGGGYNIGGYYNNIDGCYGYDIDGGGYNNIGG
jgi:hypothetical protein